MTKYVGLAPLDLVTELKRHLLVFDQIGFLYAGRSWSSKVIESHVSADLEWLEQKGIVFRATCLLKSEAGFKIDRWRDRKGFRIEVSRDAMEGKLEGGPAWAELIKRVGIEHRTIVEFLKALEDFACRWEAQRLRREPGTEAVSLCAPSQIVTDLFDTETRLGDVLQIVVKNIPEPSELTSLECILAFREDANSIAKRHALRRWARGLTRQGASAIEIVEELEWLTNEYECHMKLHDVKTRRGMVEMVVTTSAEIAENLVKLRWGKLAKLPFTLSHRKINLLEAEMTAPGREIAYVVQARKALS